MTGSKGGKNDKRIKKTSFFTIAFSPCDAPINRTALLRRLSRDAFSGPLRLPNCIILISNAIGWAALLVFLWSFGHETSLITLLNTNFKSQLEIKGLFIEERLSPESNKNIKIEKNGGGSGGGEPAEKVVVLWVFVGRLETALFLRIVIACPYLILCYVLFHLYWNL